tara:strand:+ start:243 stop:815 length:573 start_codon:yes stop_codon:yes gene_type:complete
MKPLPLLHIKNMVCPRCIMAIEGVLKELNIDYNKVTLGEVSLNKEITPSQQVALNKELQALGFELLESGKSALISRIKTLIVEQIHHKKENLQVNFSTFLSDQLHHDYSNLSRLFSSVEGITIEKFITRQKTERVKELLFYNEMNLSEIAFQMNYSSVAHLSAQFKKETGMTPSAFKKNAKPGHNALDSL